MSWLAADKSVGFVVTCNGGPGTTNLPSNQTEVELIVASATQFKKTGHAEWFC